MPDAPHPDLDAFVRDLATERVEVRAGLIEALDGVSELWLGRMLAGPLARDGWTVQHEAAHHVADDAALIALVEHAGRGVDAWTAAEVRRLRGEAMHTVQRLRLAPLRAYLAESGERAVEALHAHATDVERPFAVGDLAPMPVSALLRAQVERARAGIEAVRLTFGR